MSHNYDALVQAQREYFYTGATIPVLYRIQALKNLEISIRRHEKDVYNALKQDLNKSETESLLTEIGIVYHELHTFIKSLSKWSKPKRAASPLLFLSASAKIHPEPLGVTLIISPWNYPFQLTILPLIAAIGAGNCAVVKPSTNSAAVTQVLKDIISEAFNPKFVACVGGEGESSQALLEERYDFIFYTGSTKVGHQVMAAASKYLTPVCLELGGKSPVVITKDANLELAARRLVWAKTLNSGQTCIAPDHVWVDSSIKDAFCEKLEAELKAQWGDFLKNPEYARIINRKNFDRLAGYGLDPNLMDEENLKIAIQVLHVDESHPSMQEEIFGPVLPILTFDDPYELFNHLRTKEKPLAFYLFTEDAKIKEYFTTYMPFGGGCINDAVIHISFDSLPFGGVGFSGMGRYHGKASFDMFSNLKGVVYQTNRIDIKMRYPPYDEKTKKIFKKLNS